MSRPFSKWDKVYMWHDQGEWVGCREYWFWVTGLKRWQILMFFIVFKLQRMFISPQPDVWLRWGLDQNVTFYKDKWLMLKTQNWILLTCDSFPLIMSHIPSLIWKISLINSMWCTQQMVDVCRKHQLWNNKVTIMFYNFIRFTLKHCKTDQACQGI